jgi:hypothetical protein
MSDTHFSPMYNPGHFSYLWDYPFSKDIWAFLTHEPHIAAMHLTSRSGLAAITPLLAQIELNWQEVLENPTFPPEEVATFINNMVKQIMEQTGFEFVACGMCKEGKYIKKSGVYLKVTV